MFSGKCSENVIVAISVYIYTKNFSKFEGYLASSLLLFSGDHASQIKFLGMLVGK